MSNPEPEQRASSSSSAWIHEQEPDPGGGGGDRQPEDESAAQINATTQTSFEDDGILYTDTEFELEVGEQQAQESQCRRQPVELEACATSAPAEPQSAMVSGPGERRDLAGTHKIELLRHLLLVERQCSEQRRRNNTLMKKYLKELQTDYLRLQRELIEALELGHKIKAQRDAHLELVHSTLSDKDKLIDQLRAQIESLDEPKLRAEFEAVQRKQSNLFELEQQQLRDQIASAEQQLTRERICHSQNLQQAQHQLVDQSQLHEIENKRLREKIDNIEKELERILNEPHNLVVKTLKEDKFRLLNELDETKMMLDESKSKYEMLRRRLESLQADQEQIELRSQEEIDKVQRLCDEQRRIAKEFSLDIEDKRETIEVLQFNLQRSEKRAKSLLGALQAKEITYKEIVDQMQVKYDQLAEKSSGELRLLEQSLIDKSSLLDQKQNELKRLELDQANRLDSLRNDRDSRVTKLVMEKQQVEKELQAAEIKIAQELAVNSSKTKLIAQLKSEVDQFKQESKRLSIALATTEAKLFSKQQELDKALGGYEEIGPEQNHDHDDSRNQVVSVYELEEAKRYTKRLESSLEQSRKENGRLSLKLRVSESNLVKLNAAITKEQAKLYRECERKISQIVAEQCNYGKYRSRYKKYGNKLKRYYQHLQQIHEHFCNLETCGPMVHESQTNGSTIHASSRDSEISKSTQEYSLISID